MGMIERVIAATDFAGIAVLITALGVFITVVCGQYVAVRGVRSRVDATHAVAEKIAKDIDTLNETSVGINSANALTEKIEAIPHDERTAQEQRHLDAAPEPDPPQGPPR